MLTIGNTTNFIKIGLRGWHPHSFTSRSPTLLTYTGYAQRLLPQALFRREGAMVLGAKRAVFISLRNNCRPPTYACSNTAILPILATRNTIPQYRHPYLYFGYAQWLLPQAPFRTEGVREEPIRSSPSDRCHLPTYTGYAH